MIWRSCSFCGIFLRLLSKCCTYLCKERQQRKAGLLSLSANEVEGKIRSFEDKWNQWKSEESKTLKLNICYTYFTFFLFPENTRLWTNGLLKITPPPKKNDTMISFQELPLQVNVAQNYPATMDSVRATITHSVLQKHWEMELIFDVATLQQWSLCKLTVCKYILT